MALEIDKMTRMPGDEAFRRESLKGTQWEPTYAGALHLGLLPLPQHVAETAVTLGAPAAPSGQLRETPRAAVTVSAVPPQGRGGGR